MILAYILTFFFIPSIIYRYFLNSEAIIHFVRLLVVSEARSSSRGVQSVSRSVRSPQVENLSYKGSRIKSISSLVVILFPVFTPSHPPFSDFPELYRKITSFSSVGSGSVKLNPDPQLILSLSLFVENIFLSILRKYRSCEETRILAITCNDLLVYNKDKLSIRAKQFLEELCTSKQIQDNPTLARKEDLRANTEF